ncbi:MAG: HAD family hydrolase [Rhodospirillaceae bacterium]
MLSGIDAIIFDFDGVLNRNYDGEGFFWSRSLKADHGIETAAFTAAMFDETFKDVLTGAVDLRDRLENILPALGCKASAAEFLTYWFEKDLTPCPDLLAMVADARKAGIRCVIGTNNERHRTDFIWRRLLKDRVDGIYAAGAMGVAKPDPAFFRAIQKDLGCETPDRLLLVDDIPANTIDARALGWKAHQYGDYTQGQLGRPRDLRTALGL